MQLSKTQAAFLELLSEGPADQTGLSICGGNARTVAVLERHAGHRRTEREDERRKMKHTNQGAVKRLGRAAAWFIGQHGAPTTFDRVAAFRAGDGVTINLWEDDGKMLTLELTSEAACVLTGVIGSVTNENE